MQPRCDKFAVGVMPFTTDSWTALDLAARALPGA